MVRLPAQQPPAVILHQAPQPHRRLGIHWYPPPPPPYPSISCLCHAIHGTDSTNRFTGEGQATGDSFAEWHEHFENLARLAGWDDHWKLVHLTSNLCDTAMAFYRSCSPDVRSRYPALVGVIKRRFTPIRLTAVQAKLFHTRQQLENESVDKFAQELQKLYNLAYAEAASEGLHAERMGQTLLANQFVTGLQPHLKQKLIGVEGGLNELILKARFEEAKSQELTSQKIRTPTPSRRPPSTPAPTPTSSPTVTSAPPTSTETTTTGMGARSTRFRCYNCGMEGHPAWACPYARRGRRDRKPVDQLGDKEKNLQPGLQLPLLCPRWSEVMSQRKKFVNSRRSCRKPR